MQNVCNISESTKAAIFPKWQMLVTIKRLNVFLYSFYYCKTILKILAKVIQNCIGSFLKLTKIRDIQRVFQDIWELFCDINFEDFLRISGEISR